MQGVCFLIALAVARTGAREIGAMMLYGIPILGVVSVVTTLIAIVLAAMAWHREEETKPIVFAVLLTVAHVGLLLLAGGVLVIAAFAQ